MNLILEVAPPEAATLGTGARRVFSRAGGSIGRGSSNDWILSHRKVSGRHALISHQDGVFYIVDEGSANGVFINSMTNRLVPGKRYALRAGDRIIIDPYEISVTISNEPADEARGWPERATPSGGSDPFSPVDPDGASGWPLTPSGRGPASTPAPGPEVLDEEVDPLKALRASRKPVQPAPPVPSARDLEQGSPLEDHYRPPAVPPPALPPAVAAPPPPTPPSPSIPEDYLDHLFESCPKEPSLPAPVPVPPSPETPGPATLKDPAVDEGAAPEPGPALVAPLPSTSQAEAESRLLEVLKCAGIEHAPLTPEFARSFGQIFRIAVEGVMDLLKLRWEVKGELGIRVTQFRPADNNPLKLPTVSDALRNLFIKRNPAYLEPVEAFEDAFEDLRHHQIALLAGMRVAVETLLAQFNPDALQEQFDRQLKRSGLLAMTSRLRYWELFRERYEEITRDPDVTFRRLFGEEFAKAYDEQLRRLKAEAGERSGAARRPPG